MRITQHLLIFSLELSRIAMKLAHSLYSQSRNLVYSLLNVCNIKRKKHRMNLYPENWPFPFRVRLHKQLPIIGWICAIHVIIFWWSFSIAWFWSWLLQHALHMGLADPFVWMLRRLQVEHVNEGAPLPIILWINGFFNAWEHFVTLWRADCNRLFSVMTKAWASRSRWLDRWPKLGDPINVSEISSLPWREAHNPLAWYVHPCLPYSSIDISLLRPARLTWLKNCFSIQV